MRESGRSLWERNDKLGARTELELNKCQWVVMNLVHICCQWHECNSLVDSSAWRVPAGLSWAAKRNCVLWNAAGGLFAVLSMQKKPWNIICSMLFMQTSKQIISYGINGNLVKGVCSEWVRVTQGSATKKYLKGYWLKAAVFFVIGEQSIFSSSGELSYPKIFIDILEVNRSQIWREPGDHSLHDSYFSSACALSAGLSSQSTKWMASSSRPQWLCFSHVVFINLPREEGSVHLRI